MLKKDRFVKTAMQFDWKSYFIFTSKEQKGILVLGCILTLSLLLHYLLPATSTNNTAFSNANYCVNASVRNFSVIAASGGSITTTGVTVNTNNASMTSEDTSYVFVSIFSN